jgi:hypothetical protein
MPITMLQADKHHSQPCISVEAACRPATKAILAPQADPKAPQAELSILDRCFARKLTRGTVSNNPSSGYQQKKC